MLAPLLIAALLSISSNAYAHKIGLVGSTFIFWVSMLMLKEYYFMEAEFLVKGFEYDIFTVYKAISKPLVLNCEFFVDSISLMFLFLSSFIFFLTTFVVCENYYEELPSVKYTYILLFIMQGFIHLAFFSLSIFFFYAFFEAVLIPMYLIIII
jgi:NADH-quinone oxidoreductase subunit M